METYIGDGVYARTINGGILLWTDRQENGRNWLVLGPSEQSHLIAFMHRANNESKPPETNE